ncbi:Glucose-induced degradation protein 4 homolog [Geodia barretti]|uniref:Glucose-induced degradation protein 4 homolog n=1 Tax=Geodia barretti TaxID=519541 RepID=A0AA35T9U6_GEOBA|nr:Glucose-induced degradation protein 4 homolog [Geodia barretti]
MCCAGAVWCLGDSHTSLTSTEPSFAGFYYICFQQSKASIEGYYYHKLSEWYQSIELEHVPEKAVSVYQFH